VHKQRAAGYPYDLQSRRFAVAVPCWLSSLELMALGHALALDDGKPETHGMDALGNRCAKHQPEIKDGMIDRADWQEVVAAAFRAQFDAAGLPAFLGDHGWSLELGRVRAALGVLDGRNAELYAAVSGELDLADLVRQRMSGALPAATAPIDWPSSQPPADELPATTAARQLSERLNTIAAGHDFGPAPDALALLEVKARDEVTTMLDALRELLTPVESADDLPVVLGSLRRLLHEAEKLSVGIYLALG
jgi:hypothetical protein